MSEIIDKKEMVEISADILHKLGNLVDEMVKLYGDVRSADIGKTHFQSLDKVKFNPANSDRPLLKFDAVKAHLNREIIEKVFREFAPKIKKDDSIVIRGEWIAKGSLNMNLRIGSWKRHSTGEVGDIINFIEKAEKVSNVEALEILAVRAGIKTEFKTFRKNSSNYSKTHSTKTESNNEEELENTHNNYASSPFIDSEGNAKNFKSNKKQKRNWETYEFVPSRAPKFNPEKDLYWLKNNGSKISNTYEYQDIYGRLIGYAIRVLKEKVDEVTGEVREIKDVLPVAYCKDTNSGEEGWALKGLLVDGFKPIYGAQKIHINSSKPVLIVEGEKTADAAAELFPEFTVLSWLGGSAVIDRVDWSILKNRDIIIWPDNDGPGMKAANAIKSEFVEIIKREYSTFLNANDLEKKINKEIQIVDLEALKLPEKWDLADELPSHLTLDSIKTKLQSMLIG